MKIERKKLNIALANACLSLTDLRSHVSAATLTRAASGNDVSPKTIGRICRALNVRAEDIIEED